MIGSSSIGRWVRLRWAGTFACRSRHLSQRISYEMAPVMKGVNEVAAGEKDIGMGCGCSKPAEELLFGKEGSPGFKPVEQVRSVRRDGSEKRPALGAVAPVTYTSALEIRYVVKQ